jgi:bacillithiol system protein YtxJ
MAEGDTVRVLHGIELIKENLYFIFKHSAICHTSSIAQDEILKAESLLDIPIYTLTVQDNRELSNEIESFFDVRHESPQLILIKDGKAVWHASHSGIKARNIQDAVARF